MKDIKRMMQHNIHGMYHKGHGTSKRHAKEVNEDGKSPYVHASSTVDTYLQLVGSYGDWLKENAPDGRKCSLDDAKALAPQYLEARRLEGDAASTLCTRRQAIAKALGCSGPELGFVPERRGVDIIRGRTESPSAAKAAERAPDDLEMCRAFGPRHNKECNQVTRESCHWGADGHIDYIHIDKGKGGRERDAFVLPGEGRDILEARWANAKDGECLFNLGAMKGANVHACRADYAARAYNYAMEHGAGNGREYHPRDGSGRVYDKGGLDVVSDWLGHGNDRYYTVYYSYVSYGH